METIKIKKTDVPPEAMANYEFTSLDYTDAFCVRGIEDFQLNMRELAYHVFGKIESFPVVVRFFLQLRDLLVKPFGLKTAADIEEIAGNSDWIGFFRIYQHSEDEIIIGADDRHLDVRVSFLRTIHNNKPSLTVSTFVRLNNLLGEVYFTIIKPFHKMIVPATIKKSMRQMRNNGVIP